MRAGDPVVTDTNGDGTGDAILTFDNGESITLQGVSVTEVDSYQEQVSIGMVCYVTGTAIATDRGEVRVEDLQEGDLVLTARGTHQPILWRDSTQVSAETLAETANLRPVRIKPGAFGNDNALFVSQQYCMAIEHCGETRLVRAKHLAEYTPHAHIAKPKGAVTYHHILLPEHAIIFADGAPSESFYPGPQSLKVLSKESLACLAQAIGPRMGETVADAYGPTV